jgi:hypothetical protein
LTIIEDTLSGAMMGTKTPPLLAKPELASERTGWGREICGYQGTAGALNFSVIRQTEVNFRCAS